MNIALEIIRILISSIIIAYVCQGVVVTGKFFEGIGVLLALLGYGIISELIGNEKEFNKR